MWARHRRESTVDPVIALQPTEAVVACSHQTQRSPDPRALHPRRTLIGPGTWRPRPGLGMLKVRHAIRAWDRVHFNGDLVWRSPQLMSCGGTGGCPPSRAPFSPTRTSWPGRRTISATGRARRSIRPCVSAVGGSTRLHNALGEDGMRQEQCRNRSGLPRSATIFCIGGCERRYGSSGRFPLRSVHAPQRQSVQEVP